MSAVAMQAGIIVAVIAAATSLAVSLGSAATTARRERDARRDVRADQLADREALAEETVARVREPLLTAALDLAHRIDNIRNKNFLDAYGNSPDEHRAAVARSSTLYRFARYWCIVERLSDEVELLQLRRHGATGDVTDCLREIGRTFASDKYEGGLFMVWREEQRAIAELMADDKTALGCIGYATFVQRYDETLSSWFSTLQKSFDAGSARSSTRLALVQQHLADLSGKLDVNQTYRDQWERLAKTADLPH